MTNSAPKFTREQIERFLERLNHELAQLGVTGEICIVGGAALVLGFGCRNSTRDIDALVIAPPSIRAAAQKVAELEQIPSSWLNDGAKGFASSQPIETKEILQMSHLRVVSPPAEYILAMKCIAARVGIDDNDKADAKFLIKYLKLTDSEAVLSIVGRYYNEKLIPAKTQYFIQEICDELFPPASNVE
jgi:hypothetical protein